MNKNTIRLLAEAERLIDEGLIPYVWALGLNGNYDRLPVNQDVMDDLGLVTGQKVNSIIVEAIYRASQDHLKKLLDITIQKQEEELLDPNFDYRSMM